MLILGLVDVPLWLILIPAIGLLLYRYGTRNFDYFTKAGIPGPKPLPFLGTMMEFLSGGFEKYDIELRKKYGNTVGTFNGNKPNLIVFDQEMISQVTVKQFSHFVNREVIDNGDNILNSMLTSLQNEKWKRVRSTMSPTFTTGKLRQMSSEINRSAKQLAENITSKKEPFETLEYASAYTMDVIASSAFGLRVDSQSNKENAFTKHGKALVDVSFKNPVVIFGFLFPPLAKLFKKLGYSYMDESAVNFFVDVFRQTLATRKEGDTKRSDFLQLMTNAKQGKAIHNKEDEHEVEKHFGNEENKGISDDEIFANALIFFFAGYDTTSIGLTQLIYCLATNPECQKKVCDEIDTILGEKENVDYDDVAKMHYLEQCLNESLRLYPGAPRVDRVVTEDITINGIFFKKGTSVTVPVQALHRDNDIWENAEKFNPDRFSPEEKAKRNPITWLPFGYGPRNCIGMRLALYEIKVAVAYILRHHKLVTCEKTENPIVWQSGKWLKSQNGIWLKTEKRE